MTTMTTAPRYRGFSTTARRGVRTETYDVELVVQDILNHFNIVPGEIPGRPAFGCYLRVWCGDPFDERTEERVRDEVLRVIAADPRVRPVGISVNSEPDIGSVVVFGEIEMIETGEKSQINLTIPVAR